MRKIINNKSRYRDQLINLCVHSGHGSDGSGSLMSTWLGGAVGRLLVVVYVFAALPLCRDDDYVNCRKVKGKLNTSAYALFCCSSCKTIERARCPVPGFSADYGC